MNGCTNEREGVGRGVVGWPRLSLYCILKIGQNLKGANLFGLLPLNDDDKDIIPALIFAYVRLLLLSLLWG